MLAASDMSLLSAHEIKEQKHRFRLAVASSKEITYREDLSIKSGPQSVRYFQFGPDSHIDLTFEQVQLMCKPMRRPVGRPRSHLPLEEEVKKPIFGAPSAALYWGNNNMKRKGNSTAPFARPKKSYYPSDSFSSPLDMLANSACASIKKERSAPPSKKVKKENTYTILKDLNQFQPRYDDDFSEYKNDNEVHFRVYQI